jgi:hypothetical protein
MKLLNVYALTALFSHVRPSLTPTKKICRDCIHFIGNDIECRKFGDTNIITGKVTYDSAISARQDEKKCGENAVLFEKNKLKVITVPYYFLKNSWPILIPTGFLGLYVYVLLSSLPK